MKHWRARHFPRAADTKRLRGGQAATVAGHVGPGFHTWPAGHIHQDTDPKRLRRRSSRHCSRVRWPRFPHLALRPHPSRQWLRIRFDESGHILKRRFEARCYAAFLQNASLFCRVDSQGWHPGLVCDAPSAHGIVLRPRLRAMPWAFTGRPVGAGKVWFVSWPLPVGAGKAWFVSQPLPVGAGKARFVSRPLPVGAGKAWFLARPSPLDSRPAATHLLLAVPKPPPYKGISPTGNPRPFRAAPRPRGRHHILFP
jgi:hypothetical protein